MHPSWRDLVIEHLRADDEARVHFLRHCSIHGALLALSSAGGASGQRHMPLLQHDADWDALTDRLYDIVPDLEQAEVIGVLDVLRFDGGRPDDRTEADALRRAVMGRLATVWKSSRSPIALPALEAWLAVGKDLSPRPAPPAVGVTWADLLPVSVPDFSDRAALERFADWLTLAELLFVYDRRLLGGLGFPGQSRRHCDGFLDALEESVRRVHTRDIDRAARALAAIGMLIEPLAERADAVLYRLGIYQYAEIEPTPEIPMAPDAEPSRRTGHLDVQRVLKDL
ncbi:MAG: hypothetical protein M3065_00740 [Actinomycetota bacterium]|nr:hypothetical protein [Actinomycetota bacterium]